MASSSNVSFEDGEREEDESAVDKFGFIGGKLQNVTADLPVEILRHRELKWLEMLENWDLFMTKRYKKVRDRCRKGIPPALRARAWQYLCGANFYLQNCRHKFTELDGAAGDPRWVEDIKKDLHRQFPTHEIFAHSQGHGQADLLRVLKAYSLLDPGVGYCQAQAPLAAALLTLMPAEGALWCLLSLCQRYLPGYYAPGLEAVQVDGDILFALLKKSAPAVHKHLKKQRIEPVLYMTEWFMCAFTRTLPWSTVLRVWDCFLCEGVKVLFRVGVVLLKSALGDAEALRGCPSLYETLERIRHLPPHCLAEDHLMAQVAKVGVSESDLEREHLRALAERRALTENGAKKKE